MPCSRCIPVDGSTLSRPRSQQEVGRGTNHLRKEIHYTMLVQLNITAHSSYISPIAPAISVHSKSTWPSNCLRAKLLNSGSGSDRKPIRPAADTSPTMAGRLGRRCSMLRWRFEGNGSCQWPSRYVEDDGIVNGEVEGRYCYSRDS